MPFHEIIGHQRPIEWLVRAVKTDRLGHAYLFYGEPTIGKCLTATALAQFLQCEHPIDDPQPDACGSCRSCQQILHQSHPDLYVLRPQDDTVHNPKIKIDQLREIEHFVIYRPLLGSHKICLIDPADAMTTEAANALLKTLEDPPAHCVFLLISSHPENLLPTIRSRCLPIRFSPLPVAMVEEYLASQTDMSPEDARLLAAFSEGRLGSAVASDPAELRIKLQQFWALLFDHPAQSSTVGFDQSEALVKSGQVQEAIHWFGLGLRDLLALTLDQTTKPKIFQDQETALRRLAQDISPHHILDLANDLQVLEKGQQRNLNLQLGLEQFFLRLHDSMQTT